MADPEIPAWLKTLPPAPVYRPTETEFSDPIAFISRVEREAAAFGICKVIPPLPKPSKRFVLSNLNRSLAKSPELAPGATPAPATDAGVFTTRHQELGSRRARPPVHKQVWQSGEVYTIEQFEAKSKAFSRAHLGGFKEVSPLLVEALFWKAAAEKPIYVEYANDVPGSGFSVPDENLRYYSHRWKGKRRFDRGRMGAPKCPCPATSANATQQKASGLGGEREATAGWRLSNSSWNLQVIARSPGSLTRFMPDEVPGVTSPMVYIGMLFSWFAWHVEDHELHSLNFLHTGSPKTWYAVPGGYASAVEEIVRVQGYGGNIDRLAALTMLGEKTTLLSPEVFMASGVPCCRLVQNPGEFVVTFPRAYHVGFSHGFNCGEAANFATPQWLKVAKDAAVRRAAMNYLPMLSHQQLLYMLAMSFISRIPRSLLPGVRSSRLKDRKKEEREILVKKAFLNDLMNENYLLCALLAKESTSYAVLWEPELLPSSYTGSQSFSSSSSLEAFGSVVKDGHGRETIHSNLKGETLFDCKTDNFCVENALHEVAANLSSVRCDNIPSIETEKSACHIGSMSLNMETLEDIDVNEDDLPFGLNVDPGSLACVSCGVLGYPFMAIVQPSERASKEFFPVNSEESHQESGDSGCLNLTSCLPSTVRKLNSDDLTEASIKFASQGNLDSSGMLYPTLRNLLTEGPNARCPFNLSNIDFNESSHIAATSEVTGGKVSRTLSGRRVESQSSRMPHSPGNKSTINARKIFMNEDGCGYFSRLFEHRMDQFKPLNEDDSFSPHKGTKIGDSNGLHLCDRLEKFKRTIGVKENAIAENDSSITILSGIRPIYKTDTLLGAPVEKSGKKINKMWNTSNKIIRPRVFCLQHALEIEELLQCKGGANVLIICHSDYVKIKAHAISIAEEIGSRFNCKDVPLENASLEDLDLLNASIDDEEHEEHGEDWTSKLGLNLRYCVKLRKQASPNQQQLTLSLGGLFSESLPVSVVSSLKWRSRKSRTPYKVIGIVQAKSASGANIEKGEVLARDSNSGSGKGIQVYESRKSGLGGAAKKKNHDLPRKCVLSQELCTSKETETSNHRSTSGHVNFLNMEVENNNTDRLLTIPILIAENFLLHQDGRAMEKFRVPHDTANPSRHIEIPPKELNNMITVCDPVESQRDEVWMFEGSEMYQGIHTDEEPSKKRKAGGGYKKPEFQAHSMETEVEKWKVQQEIRVVAESGSAHLFVKSVGSLASESSARTSVDYSEDLHEVPVAWAPNLQASFCTSMLTDDQPITAPVLSSNNFEMPLEVCAAEEPKMSIVDNSELMQVELSVAWENNVQLDSQSNDLNSSEMQQELHCASEMEGSGKGNDSPEMPQELRGASEIGDCGGKVSDCVKSSGHPVAGQMVECSEKHSWTWFSDEAGPNPTVDGSAKPAPPSLYVAVAESSAVHDAVENPMDANAAGADDRSSTKDNLKPTIVYKSYVRRNKRKREAEAAVDDRHSCSSFIRSPCEGLRPRTGRAAEGRVQTKTAIVKARKKADGPVGRRGKVKGTCECDVEGCRLNFRNREELLLHKRRNHRTHKGGRKRLSSHQSAARHDDERPLKCPWKGCSMSFKWAWARTEHVRLHTGERPYKCKVAGCELTFRFISDFSRHRRKTGHSGGS